MFARIVQMNLKANSHQEFAQAMENQIIPLLRGQKGFRDLISCVSTDGREVTAVSLWDRKEDAEAYARSTFSETMRALDNLTDGSPKVTQCDVSNSTFHKIGIRTAGA